MNENVGYALAAGAVLKHLVPSNKVNRFIPFVNMGVIMGMNLLNGKSVGESLIGGIMDSVMASGAHKIVKTSVLGDAQFIPGWKGNQSL